MNYNLNSCRKNATKFSLTINALMKDKTAVWIAVKKDDARQRSRQALQEEYENYLQTLHSGGNCFIFEHCDRFEQIASLDNSIEHAKKMAKENEASMNDLREKIASSKKMNTSTNTSDTPHNAVTPSNDATRTPLNTVTNKTDNRNIT